MIFDTIESFGAVLAPHAPILGLDLGTKTIGLALSDLMLTIATPQKTVRRTKFMADAAEVLEFAMSRRVTGLVLGLPMNMDASEGPRAQSTRAFARNLTKITELPITFWDERLSTVAAERVLIAADTSRKRRAEVIDHVAAAFILQGVLDRLHHIRAAR
jgi:putative Holliday junction resolvase